MWRANLEEIPWQRAQEQHVFHARGAGKYHVNVHPPVAQNETSTLDGGVVRAVPCELSELRHVNSVSIGTHLARSPQNDAMAATATTVIKPGEHLVLDW